MVTTVTVVPGEVVTVDGEPLSAPACDTPAVTDWQMLNGPTNGPTNEHVDDHST